ECGSFTMTAGDLTENVDLHRFMPAEASGDQAIGITRVENIEGKAVRTTVSAANVVDGVAIQVIEQQPSTEPLPDELIDHFQERTSQILQNVSETAGTR